MLGFLSLRGLKRLVTAFTRTFSFFANTTAGEAENNTSHHEERCFWVSLYLTVESSEELYSAFPQVIVEAPDFKNTGIRPLRVDEILEGNNPPVIFIAPRLECNAETRDLAAILSSIHIAKPRITQSALPDPEWNRWSLMRDYLLTSLTEFHDRLKAQAPYRWRPGGYHSRMQYPQHFQDRNLFNGAFVYLMEVWNDKDSFPSPASVSRTNYGESGSHTKPSGSTSDAWFLGRTWTINPKDQALPIHIALFAASQVCLNNDTDLKEWPKECAWMLPLAFSWPWPSSPWIRFCCKGQKFFHAQFHIRYWTVNNAATDSQESLPKYSGVRTHREAFEITSYRKKTPVLIREARVSVGVLALHSSPRSNFSMVSLADDPGLSFDVHERDYWQTFALEQSPALAGFVVILAAVFQMINQWVAEWTKTLKSFDVLETPGTNPNKCPAMADEDEISLKQKQQRQQQQQQQQLLKTRLGKGIIEAEQVILDTSSWVKNFIEDFIYLIESLKCSLGDAATNSVLESCEKLSNHHRAEENSLSRYLSNIAQELGNRLMTIARRFHTKRYEVWTDFTSNTSHNAVKDLNSRDKTVCYQRFFASAWINKDAHTLETPPGLLNEYYKLLDEISLGLPVQLHEKIEEVRRELPRLFRSGYPVVFQHEDLLENNIHVDDGTGHITGIIDWADSKISPFGVSLASMEVVLGIQTRTHWRFHPNHHSLRELFWESFYQVTGPISDDDRRTIEVARLFGFFREYGFEEREYAVAYLSALCLV